MTIRNEELDAGRPLTEALAPEHENARAKLAREILSSASYSSTRERVQRS
jgi:hypothetical protein